MWMRSSSTWSGIHGDSFIIIWKCVRQLVENCGSDEPRIAKTIEGWRTRGSNFFPSDLFPIENEVWRAVLCLCSVHPVPPCVANAQWSATSTAYNNTNYSKRFTFISTQLEYWNESWSLHLYRKKSLFRCCPFDVFFCFRSHNKFGMCNQEIARCLLMLCASGMAL